MTPLYTISRASNENPELIIASFVNTSALSDSSDIDEAQQFETINSGLQELAQKIDRVAQTTPLNQNRQDRLDALSFDLMDFEGMAAKFPHGEKLSINSHAALAIENGTWGGELYANGEN